jgi:Rrf2 family protein
MDGVDKMLVSSKGRYALRVMLELADNSSGEFISLKKISENQNISLKYLEIIVSLLNKAKLVDSHRGKNGGYRLNKLPENYQVGEILRITEDGLIPVDCNCLNGSKKSCEMAANCRTKKLWGELDKLVNGYLDKVSLKDLQNGKVTF